MMQLLRSILATTRFEMFRVLTFQRLGFTAVLALFPPFMLSVVMLSEPLREVAVVMTAVFSGTVCLLSLLLWATPNVYSELEGRSWTFVTSRPYGRWSILFGKYLLAVFWSFLIGWTAMTLSIVQIAPQHINAFHVSSTPSTDSPDSTPREEQVPQFFEREDGQLEMVTRRHDPFEQYPEEARATPFQVWLVFSILLALASIVYAAVFSFFGVIAQRRAMAFVVGYFILFEVLLAILPANAGKLTFTYHLFCLQTHWLGWMVPARDLNVDRFQEAYGLYSSWIHLSAILAASGVMLWLSALVVRQREYITLEDHQV